MSRASVARPVLVVLEHVLWLLWDRVSVVWNSLGPQRPHLICVVEKLQQNDTSVKVLLLCRKVLFKGKGTVTTLYYYYKSNIHI